MTDVRRAGEREREREREGERGESAPKRSTRRPSREMELEYRKLAECIFSKEYTSMMFSEIWASFPSDSFQCKDYLLDLV